jgi:hypothetical protein
MNPVRESRSLPSTLAIVASLVLVCGGLLLLTSTAPWSSRPEAASEASAPVAADAPVEAPVPVTIALAPPSNDGLPPASDETAGADRGETAEAAEAQPSSPQQATPDPVETVHPDPSSVPAEDSVAASGVPHIDETPADTAEAAKVDEAHVSARCPRR